MGISSSYHESNDPIMLTLIISGIIFTKQQVSHINKTIFILSRSTPVAIHRTLTISTPLLRKGRVQKGR